MFDGGCIVYRYRFAPGSEPALVIEADRAVSTLPRATIVAEVRRDARPHGLRGRGATVRRIGSRTMLTDHRRAFRFSLGLLACLVFMLVAVGRHPEEPGAADHGRR